MTAIDLFSGAGGFTQGARDAKVSVLWAANHWLEARNAFALNHPETQAVCQDLHQADWTTVPRTDLLLASAACQGHTHARGADRPHHDAARSTAWAVVSCAETLRPEAIVNENVCGFLQWALYPAWKLALEALGYTLNPHILDAADHGVAQHRVRVFIIATLSRAPFVLRHIRRERVPFESIIDTSANGWTRVSSKCARTKQRVKNGREKYGSRFVMPYYKSGSGLTGRSLARPLGTVTTRDRWALVDGRVMRMLNVSEYRAAMGFPKSYQLPANRKLAKHLLGNAVCPPQAADILTDLRERL